MEKRIKSADSAHGIQIVVARQAQEFRVGVVTNITSQNEKRNRHLRQNIGVQAVGIALAARHEIDGFRRIRSNSGFVQFSSKSRDLRFRGHVRQRLGRRFRRHGNGLDRRYVLCGLDLRGRGGDSIRCFGLCALLPEGFQLATDLAKRRLLARRQAVEGTGAVFFKADDLVGEATARIGRKLQDGRFACRPFERFLGCGHRGLITLSRFFDRRIDGLHLHRFVRGLFNHIRNRREAWLDLGLGFKRNGFFVRCRIKGHDRSNLVLHLFGLRRRRQRLCRFGKHLRGFRRYRINIGKLRRESRLVFNGCLLVSQMKTDAAFIDDGIPRTHNAEAPEAVELARAIVSGQGGQIDRNAQIRAFDRPENGFAGPGVAPRQRLSNLVVDVKTVAFGKRHEGLAANISGVRANCVGELAGNVAEAAIRPRLPDKTERAARRIEHKAGRRGDGLDGKISGDGFEGHGRWHGDVGFAGKSRRRFDKGFSFESRRIRRDRRFFKATRSVDHNIVSGDKRFARGIRNRSARRCRGRGQRRIVDDENEIERRMGGNARRSGGQIAARRGQ